MTLLLAPSTIRAIKSLPDWRHLAFDATSSTNADALRLAADGDEGRLWITAREQTSGRGRRRRIWVSPVGNLYASLLLIAPAPPASLSQLPFVAALALYEAIAAIAPDLRQRLAIKWPNDLLLDGGKTAGILLESTMVTDGRNAVVTGFGVNCLHCPPDTPYPVTSLREAGFSGTPTLLFEALCETMAAQLRIWSEGAGFSIIRRDWLDRAMGRGQKLVARLAEEEVEGIFEDLDETGRLILRLGDGGVRVITAGDIFFAPSVHSGT